MYVFRAMVKSARLIWLASFVNFQGGFIILAAGQVFRDELVSDLDIERQLDHFAL